jgi:hypothetical protein
MLIKSPFENFSDPSSNRGLCYDLFRESHLPITMNVSRTAAIAPGVNTRRRAKSPESFAG